MARDLELEEREEIRAGIERGDTGREIARILERSPSTIGGEIARNGGRRRYRAATAQRRAAKCRHRPQVTKLERHPSLAAAVEMTLEGEKLSPQVISKQIAAAGGVDGVTVGHDCIYRAVYAHGRLGLKKGLHKNLHRRRRRPKRRHKNTEQPADQGPLGKYRPLASRPLYISKRRQVGHWEGDLIIGAYCRSAIVTLIERATRFALMAASPHDHGADAVLDALVMLYDRIHPSLCRTLTWDQGREMARHAELAEATGQKIYFAEPHSPWQRGANENLNGLLRRWLPKGTDLSIHTQDDLDVISARVNTMPRRIHDWQTAQQRYDRALSM